MSDCLFLPEEKTKVCTICLVSKSLSHFAPNRGRCDECEDKHKNYLRQYVRGLKSKPCADCGEKFPYYVMDFDHLDEQTKRSNISKLMNERCTLQFLKDELAKCELVCANCHRKRTFQRRDATKPSNPLCPVKIG